MLPWAAYDWRFRAAKSSIAVTARGSGTKGGKLTTALQHGDRSATRKAVVHATSGSGEYHCGLADGLNSAKHSNESFAESRFASES